MMSYAENSVLSSNEENMEILKFFSSPANKSKRYSILLEIENS
jgi:hypothetical protein